MFTHWTNNELAEKEYTEIPNFCTYLKDKFLIDELFRNGWLEFRWLKEAKKKFIDYLQCQSMWLCKGLCSPNQLSDYNSTWQTACRGVLPVDLSNFIWFQLALGFPIVVSLYQKGFWFSWDLRQKCLGTDSPIYYKQGLWYLMCVNDIAVKY